MKRNQFRVFWGSPEAWVQKRFNLNSNDLKIQLNILSLLFDEIIISPSFLIESKQLQAVLSNRQVSIESGLIRLCFGNIKHDISDYVEIKREEEFGNVPNFVKNNKLLLPDYRGGGSKEVANLWNSKFQKTKRSNNLPSEVTKLVLNDFNKDCNNGNKFDFARILSSIVKDSAYYTKYHFYQALGYAKINNDMMESWLDDSAKAFLIGSASATDSHACLIWPNNDLPVTCRRKGFIANINVVLSIFVKVLNLDKNIISSLDERAIYRIREIPEWKIFQEIYIKAIISCEDTPYAYIVLSNLEKAFSIERGKMRLRSPVKFFNDTTLDALSSTAVGLISLFSGAGPLVSTLLPSIPIIARGVTSKLSNSEKMVFPLHKIRNECLYHYTEIQNSNDLSSGISRWIMET